MCGRYVPLSEKDYEEIQRIVDEVSEKFNSQDAPKNEVFPTNYAPVIMRENDKKILIPMKWSYGEFTGRPMINARAETIIQKPMFRQSFHQRRCLIPAAAYYEWKQNEGQTKKTKYRISIDSSDFFFMAGIYNTFKDKLGNLYTGYAIITTEACKGIGMIHDRMPVILKNGTELIWLDNGLETENLLNMLKPFNSDNVLYATV